MAQLVSGEHTLFRSLAVPRAQHGGGRGHQLQRDLRLGEQLRSGVWPLLLQHLNPVMAGANLSDDPELLLNDYRPLARNGMLRAQTRPVRVNVTPVNLPDQLVQRVL